MLLNCHSYYSFKYGALSVEELLKEVSQGGHAAIALTDINNTAVSLEFVRLTQTPEYNNIRPIVGADIRNGAQQQFVAIAKNADGFREVNKFLTPHLHNREEFPSNAPDDFENVFIVYPFQSQLRELEDYEFIGVSPQDLRNLPFNPWKKHLDKLVILQTATFRNKRDYNIHRLLRASIKTLC